MYIAERPAMQGCKFIFCFTSKYNFFTSFQRP